MIGIDTNILIRFVLADEPRQVKKVKQLFLNSEKSNKKLFISSITVLETIWVLETNYEYEPTEILTVFEHLLQLKFLVFENIT